MNTNMKPYTFLLTTMLIALFSTGCESGAVLSHQESQLPEVAFQEEREVYEKAILESKLVKDQHEQGVERRKRESQELQKLLRKVQGRIESSEGDNLDKLYGQVRARFEQDLAFFQRLQEMLKLFPTREGDYPIQTNKMHLGLQKALDLTEDEFFDIIDSSPGVPQRFDFNNVPQMNIVGDRTHMFASGDGIVIKIFLATVYRVLSGKDKVSDLRDVFCQDWLDVSPWAHITPLPEGFDTTLIEDSSYFYNDKKQIPGVIIFHNGFAFGGHRCDKRDPDGKEFGPFDCSSWIASIIKSPAPFSTLHQYIDYHIRTDFSSFPAKAFSQEAKSNIVREWQADSFRSGIEESLTPIQLRDPQIDLQPGCIHGERVLPFFDVTENMSVFPKGSGGHTSLFLGMLGCGPDAQALTLGFTRNIEYRNIDAAYAVDKRLLFRPNPFDAGRSVFYHKPINF